MCKPHKHKWGSFFKDKEKTMKSEDYIEDNLPTRINSKVQQFFGGNWGHPRPYIKKKTEIKPLRTSAPKRRKKKKVKKSWFWKACPFCGEEIKSKPGENKYSIFNKIYDKECGCGAKEVEECPCCHRKTWFKDEIYKHEGYINCGFVGKKLRRKNERDKK